MSKKFWRMLDDLFATEDDIREKYSELATLVEKTNIIIELQEKTEELSKELQEMNKED